MSSPLGQCATETTSAPGQLVGLLIQTILAAKCALSPPEMWPKDYGPTAINNGLGEYDFIVVGAGSAGCVVASRLSENPDWKILLLEAGGDPPLQSTIPSMVYTMQRTVYDWGYTAEPSTTGCLGMPTGLYVPRGKFLGGSSGSNAMLYVRGNKRDFNGWSALGNPTWDWLTVLEYFKKSENQLDPDIAKDTRYHSVGGPLMVDKFHNTLPIKETVFQMIRQSGFRVISDCNGNINLGFLNAEGTIGNGARCSSAKAFLTIAKDRTNLHVIKFAQVTNVQIDENNRALGVTFEIKGQNHTFQALAQKEVILSAGAINTPQILMLSGVGPPDQLTKFDIPVKKDLFVGKNMQDHAIVIVGLAFPINAVNATPVNQMADLMYEYLIHNEGFFATIDITNVIGFISTVGNLLYPDIQIHFFHMNRKEPTMAFLIRVHGFNEDIVKSAVDANQDAEILFFGITLLNPKSRGKVELRSTNPFDAPKIYPDYFVEDDDLQTVVRGIRIMLGFTATKAFRKRGGSVVRINLPVCDQLDYNSNEYWGCYSRYMTSTIYHPVGTAKMGPDSDPEAVVDSTLKVRGIDKLRVIDASIMPLIVSGNTNAASIMIGEKGADFIKAEYT